MNISPISNQSLFSTSATSSSPKGDATASSSEDSNTASSNATQSSQLSPTQQQQLRALQARDAEVHRHELAHLSAAGGLAVSAPNYSYQTGPDGKQYAIGGDVGIDVSPGNTPQETARKAATIRAAALAPAQPSGADLAIAARASAMELQAQLEIAQAARQAAVEQPNKVSRSYGSSSGANSNPVGQLLNVVA